MKPNLTDTQLDQLSVELDLAIDQMESAVGGVRVARGEQGQVSLPEDQAARLQQAVGEPAGDFLPRFKRAARKETCEPGGFIHDQWAKYEEIAKKDLLKVSAAVLAGMGITGGALLAVVVPVVLWVFTALTSIGISALCDDDTGQA
jgi:hypothetical protein